LLIGHALSKGDGVYLDTELKLERIKRLKLKTIDPFEYAHDKLWNFRKLN